MTSCWNPTTRALRASLLPFVGMCLLVCGFLRPIPTQDQAEFFEARIRPVLSTQCYECHNSTGTAKGGLRLDSRDGIRAASETGTAVVPGKPDESLLLAVVRHELPDLEMPDGGAQLSAATIADFEAWIRDGAYDPREAPPSSAELSALTSWLTTLERRKQWWSLRPIEAFDPPPASEWSEHPIDRFIQDSLAANGLEPAARADRRTLIRRMSFAVTGLPPSRGELAEYLADDAPDATERLIERLLASPHYGERWARNWMDLVRYADSHGSEGDPGIPNIYQYRDYLIRAFNADVPYDQLLREHVAGDLLPAPRINPELGLNESAIGTAHWRMVFHGFAPTDALDEKVRFVDDQINVFGKAFLANTISCARCHDHKFDAISQADYYALFGILGSCRPAMQDVNTRERQVLHGERLSQLKQELRAALAEAWLAQLDGLTGTLIDPSVEPAAANEGGTEPMHLLYPLAELRRRSAAGIPFVEAWPKIFESWSAVHEDAPEESPALDFVRWNLARDEDFEAWFPAGNGLMNGPSTAGEFALAPEGDRAVAGIYPAGAYTHRLSTKHRGVLESPRIELEDEYRVWLLVAGGGQARVRYVVQNYPRSGTVYPIRDVGSSDYTWHEFDLGYWKGDQVHFEITTARDAPLEIRAQDRSWFGLREVIVRRKGAPAPSTRIPQASEEVFRLASNAPPESRAALGAHYTQALRSALLAWRENTATDAQAMLLNACLAQDLLSNQASELPGVEPLLATYRQLEAEVPLPTRVPGLAEADAFDQPLFERGDHRRPRQTVARRFLEAIDDTPYETEQSGRLELAEDLLRADNPLTARVAANRIWHYLFGRGIVTTPDNFGRLGALPTHPELLDWLATRFVIEDWSVKQLLRLVLSSKTWQQAATPSVRALDVDPENHWLSHANVRRLEAELIRDALLSVSGQLDATRFGPGTPANAGSTRRSIYLQSRRNSLDEFLQTFDAPVPFATVGRRNVTNTPAQSLALLNDPRVVELAADWAASVLSDVTLTSHEARVAHMFESALGRPGTATELSGLKNYLESCTAELGRAQTRRHALGDSLAARQAALDRILDPVRTRLLEEGGRKPAAPDFAPFAHWDFREGLEDQVGDLHGTLHGSARLENGALVLDGNGHVSTSPIGRELRAKTLEVWVEVTQADQRGGGVVTVQDLRGGVFDSIVFAERIVRRWMAGSDNFRRTQDFGGQDEESRAGEPVHVAIAYDADGTIRGYRNGTAYGEPYRKTEPATFAARDSQVLFGLRHGAPGAGRMFRGRILEVRLHDRALSTEELASSSAGSPYVSQRAVLAALAEPERLRVDELERERAQLRTELEELGEPQETGEAWTRVAHVLFNLKEFIYVR